MTCDDCDTLFTKEGMERLYQAERNYIDGENYGSFCKAVSISDTSCDDTNGYSSLSRVFGTKLQDGTLTETDVQNFVDDMRTDDNVWAQWKAFIGRDFDRTSDDPKTIYARTWFDYRMPINFDGNNYESPLDRPEEQDQYFFDWFEGLRNNYDDTNDDTFWANAFNGLVIDNTI